MGRSTPCFFSSRVTALCCFGLRSPRAFISPSVSSPLAGASMCVVSMSSGKNPNSLMSAVSALFKSLAVFSESFSSAAVIIDSACFSRTSRLNC